MRVSVALAIAALVGVASAYFDEEKVSDSISDFMYQNVANHNFIITYDSKLLNEIGLSTKLKLYNSWLS